ncbi:hypothetical protein C7T94_04320 [Pedobacter yulinensis]|uniref:Uncharacterized protein n=2 Tax=Pedobacter yulinensis TaxID=2126353 RepID=A0A2T3HPW6_9SPHI|nr:hypothetical protein C7T94_04320 [Pedobacter yulinensis]
MLVLLVISAALNIPASAFQSDPELGFGSSSVRYAPDQASPDMSKTWQARAWKAERIHTQLLVRSKSDLKNVRVTFSGLKKAGGGTIAGSQLDARFVELVWTDEFGPGCGHRKTKDFDSSQVADRISNAKTKNIPANNLQAVWLTADVPATAEAGDYQGQVTVHAGKAYTLPVKITVIDRRLPDPAAYSFDLDLWQHPVAIARVQGLKAWSAEHFAAMKPYYTMLARAGQKRVTVSMIDEPWNHQTYDDFPSLITWTKKKDGNWSYDYTLFDQYVQFVMDCGINKQISCYTMIPWKLAFTYQDETTGRKDTLKASPGSAAYNEFWARMLKDFGRHLRQKGWFEKTAISMDERPMKAMQEVIKLVKSVDPAWKLTMAGDYHPEIQAALYDYCIASKFQFEPEVLAARRKQGMISTWYTCCTEPYPNGFTFSGPDEHVWIGWYTAAKDFDGYLRWAYNSWPARPFEDSRFTSWPAGDTYQVYPDAQTSIRFEKLIEGVQDFEKIRQLRGDWKKKGETAKLRELEALLKSLEIANLARETATKQLEKGRELLNR